MMKSEEDELFERAARQPLCWKVKHSLDLLKHYEADAVKLNPSGYFIAFSGGKDSCVIKELAKMAGVRFESEFNRTTIEPPESLEFVKKYHPDTRINLNRPEGFFGLMRKYGMPTPTGTWCCSKFKEGRGAKSITIIGVRAEESAHRRKIWSEFSIKNGRKILIPIYYWTREDVWGFIRERGLPYCKLYDEGFDRVGCIGCPQQSIANLNAQFKRWPRWERAYRLTAKKYWEYRQNRIAEGKFRGRIDESIKTWEEYWEKWRWQKGRACFNQCLYEEMRKQFPM